MSNLTSKAIAQIVNRHIEKSHFRAVRVSASDFDTQLFKGQFVTLTHPFNNFCRTILNQVCKNRFGSTKPYYHYKDAATGLLILNSKTLRANNLPTQEDVEEFQGFMRHMGRNDLFQPAEKSNLFFPHRASTLIEDLREGTHIVCVTNEANSKKCWVKHGDNGKGVCFRFRFRNFNRRMLARHQPLFEFREVVYNDGAMFAFFQAIDQEVFKEFGVRMLYDGIPSFAKFCKDIKYSWECETRLAFDQRFAREAYGIGIGNHYCIREDGGKWFIELPLFDSKDKKHTVHPVFGTKVFEQCPGFRIDLEAIICGPFIDPEVKKEVDLIRSQNYPNARLIDYCELISSSGIPRVL